MNILNKIDFKSVCQFLHKHLFIVYYSIIVIALAIFLTYFNREIRFILSIKNVSLFVLSVVLMISLYLLSAWGWQLMLKQHDIIINIPKAIVSENLFVIGKYVPGKIWLILGSSAYLARDGHNFGLLSMIGIKANIISIWCGLLVGSLSIFYFSRDVIILWLFALALLSVILYNKSIHAIISKRLGVISKDKINLPYISLRESFPLIAIYLATWIGWALAFYIFGLSIYPGIGLLAAFIFPLAVNLGNFTFFLPGGIGFREGVIAGFLILNGVPGLDATAISITSRLWWMVGELLIFLIAWLMDFFYLRRHNCKTAARV